MERTMVQLVVLAANGDKRTMKTMAFGTSPSGAGVAKALRKAKVAEHIGTYSYKDKALTVWGWKEGKAGTENKHELPPFADGTDAPLLFGDVVVALEQGNFTVDEYTTFYDEAFGGFEDLHSDEDEAEEYDAEEEVEVEEVEDDEEEEEEEDVVEEEEEEDEEEDEDDDCYDDGDENGGGGKRRAPRRKTIAAPEYRRMDMGLKARVKVPSPLGKRAPKWQTAPELEEESYDS